MCGIAGLLGTFPKSAITAMAANLAHRGPDGEGLWRDEKAGLAFAHRRLAIIDTTDNAAQPMPSADGRYITLFNGEIYNFKKVVEFLQKNTTYKFNQHSDTAVLAPLYDMEGPAMLDRLEGMFAFAIWDKQERKLFIARDHAGIKPLYYAETPQGLTFASELKALRPVLKDWSLDHAAMAEYLTFLWTPGERTMLQGVKKLKPGHYMLAEAGEGTCTTTIHRWYQPPQAPLENGKPLYDTTKSPADLLKLLDAVVAEQCTSDVPVGAFLSGGVDSSAIVASMVATGNRPAQTYCIGFAGEGMASEGFEDDMAFAQSVAKHLNVPFTPLTVELDTLLARLPTLPFMLDEPTADPAPLFVQDIAARARADGVKVLLGGAGGDDVFSGYRRHQTAVLREQLGQVLCQIGGLGAALGSKLLGGATSRRLTRLADLLQGNDEHFLMHAFTTNSQPDAWKLLREPPPPPPSFQRKLEPREAHQPYPWDNALTSAITESEGQSLLNRLLYLELFGFLPDHNLNYNDKAAMMEGIEGRVPLTDRRILEFMSDVPPWKKTEGWLHRTAPKAFFKHAMAPRLPQAVLTRSKAGFGAPIRKWLTHGKGRAMMEEALFDSPFTREHFHTEALQTFWHQTRTGTLDGTYTALAIANMAWWWDSFVIPD